MSQTQEAATGPQAAGTADAAGDQSTETIETRGEDRVDLLRADANNDGQTDVWVSDTDGDGKADLFQFDTDGDGQVNITMVDLDEDGTPDTVVYGDGGHPPVASESNAVLPPA